MSVHAQTMERFEELATRTSNAITVTLLWRRLDNHVKVAVFDPATETGFDVDVANSPPMDVFHHPFAYASRRSARAPVESELVPA